MNRKGWMIAVVILIIMVVSWLIGMIPMPILY